MAPELTSEQIANSKPLVDLARELHVTKRTLHEWRDKGRLNSQKTKMVRLRCVWLPMGCWGSCREFYDEFIRELQEVE